MTAASVDYSPTRVDAVIGIAPVQLMDTREPALMAVHPDGCVTAWSPQDPSALLMRKRQINAMCVASAYDVTQYSSLVWFGAVNGVKCYRARRRDGRYVHLQFLYHLSLEGIPGIRELQTNGDSLIGMTSSTPPQVVLWTSIDPIANAENITEQAEMCVFKYVCGHNTTMFLSPFDEVSSFLIHDTTVWLGYSTGSLLILDVKSTTWDEETSCILRTAGASAVTVLSLLKCSPQASFVVSGLENGDIILWTVNGALHVAQYFKHTSAICAITSVPWIDGLCTLSYTHEIFFWKWQNESSSLVLVKRGKLDDDMGKSAPRCICAIRDTEILACGAETSHILRWKPEAGPCEAVNVPPTVPPTITNNTEIVTQQLEELRNECRRWQNLYVASEVERQSAEDHALTSQADAAELRWQIRSLEEKISKWHAESSVDLNWQKDVQENNSQIENLATDPKASRVERDEILERTPELEEGEKRISELQGVTLPTVERGTPEMKEEEEGRCGSASKPQSMEQGERRHVEGVFQIHKGVNTGDVQNVTNTHIFPRLDKGVQVTSIISSQPSERTEEKLGMKEGNKSKKKEEGKKKEDCPIKVADVAPACSDTRTNNSAGYVVHESISTSAVSKPLMKFFLDEAKHRSCSSSLSSPSLAHDDAEDQKYQNQCMVLNHDNVGGRMVTQTHEGDRNGLAKLVKREDTVPSCVAKSLQVQLALVESLLRSHRMASVSSDHIPVYSTNILTDVYFMTRDILGADEASAITEEALGRWPLVNEREVVCRLFYILCCRYRTMFFQSSSKIEKCGR